MSRFALFLFQIVGAPRSVCFPLRQTAVYAASAPLEIAR